MGIISNDRVEKNKSFRTLSNYRKPLICALDIHNP